MDSTVTYLKSHSRYKVKQFKDVKLAIDTTVRARLLRASIADTLIEQEITYSELEILCGIECYEVVYMPDIASYLLRTPASVLDICEKLESKNLICLDIYDKNYGKVAIKLTEQGKNIFKRLGIRD